MHQPLHCTSRFSKSQPDGDQGGNLVFVTLGSGAGRNLHSFWDDIVGTDTSDASVNGLAAGIATDYIQQRGAHPRLARDPKKWVDEGFQLAKSEVYTFGLDTGSREESQTCSQPTTKSTLGGWRGFKWRSPVSV